MNVPARPTRSALRHPGFFLRLVNKRLAQVCKTETPRPSQPAAYATLADALKAFFEWLDYPDFTIHYRKEFDQVVDLIEYSDLSKGFIQQLALDLRAAFKLPQSTVTSCNN